MLWVERSEREVVAWLEAHGFSLVPETNDDMVIDG